MTVPVLEQAGRVTGMIAWFAFCLADPKLAWSHDIYTDVHGKDGRLCCGGNDCAATTYSEDGSHYSFLTREGRWVAIPPERITFLPVPGDPPSGDSHRAHLCYRQATDDDRAGPYSENVFDGIYLYCAFIPPGGV